jgi:hypothetical protein
LHRRTNDKPNVSSGRKISSKTYSSTSLIRPYHLLLYLNHKFFNSNLTLKKNQMKRVKLLCLIALLSITTQLTWGQVSLASWTFTNVSPDWGPSPAPPTTTSSGVTVVGLTRGSGVTTLNAGAGTAWGGNGFFDGVAAASQTPEGAVTLGNYFTFTMTATGGNTMSLSEIGAYNIRKSSTGPGAFKWQYSLDGTSFTDIGGTITTGSNGAVAGNPQSAIALNSITDLQNIPSGTTVTFRIVAWNCGNQGGNFYFNSGSTNPSLTITGTLGSTPLPLTLISFKGQSENNVNVLNWSTANEENVSAFELERGTNGYSFDKIATLSAKGNLAEGNNNYKYKDATAGTTAYYRLKMLDRDGKANYSDIVVLRKDAAQGNINVYPNPAESTLYLDGVSNNSSYRVTDAMGRAVISSTVVSAENAPASVNISGLVQGIYFLQLTDNNGTAQTVRFVKK